MCFVCPSWLSFILYNPARKLLTDRQDILDKAGVESGSVVLEVGAGNGFLTEVLALRAERVIAVELQEGMIRKLQKRVPPRPGRIDILKGDISTISVEESAVDVCLLYYSFHEVGDKHGAVANICRTLKKGGLLAIYEPRMEVDQKDMEATIFMFEEAGCSLELAGGSLFTRFARLSKIA